MVTAKEYILLSILSYCNFGESEYGKTVLEVINSKKSKEIIIGNFEMLYPENREVFLKYFKAALEKWKIFYVDNRTVTAQDYSVSGFYAVVFQCDGRYVIAYRGSETFPIEDAYKDFIETDLAIGMGRIPLQFYEGTEVYKKIVKEYKIDPDKVTITGHSLGGGIAQYVALTIDKEEGFIPRTYTWNAVGINRDGIVSVLEFVDLYEILKENTDLSEKEIEFFEPFKNPYLAFLSKELKRAGIVKDEITVSNDLKGRVELEINEEFMKRLLKNTNVEECLMRFPIERRRNLVLEQRFLGVIFQLDNISELLYKAQKLIKRIQKNKVYEKKIINFGHSQDLTNSLFRHLGTSYLVDKKFEKRGEQKTSFFNNLRLFTKSIQDLHFEDVFLAFITSEGENAGNFSQNLNNDFIASSLRKLITMEYCLSNKFLASYYSLEKIDEENFEKIKGDVLQGLENTGVELLYKKKITDQIQKMSISEFSELWEKIKQKLPSPYKNVDIFDIFIFDRK